MGFVISLSGTHKETNVREGVQRPPKEAMSQIREGGPMIPGIPKESKCNVANKGGERGGLLYQGLQVDGGPYIHKGVPIYNGMGVPHIIISVWGQIISYWAPRVHKNGSPQNFMTSASGLNTYLPAVLFC